MNDKQKEYNRRRYEKNKAKIKEYNRKRYHKKKAKMSKEEVEKMLEKRRQNFKKWWAKKKDEYKAKRREYYKKNKERFYIYAKIHKERKRLKEIKKTNDYNEQYKCRNELRRYTEKKLAKRREKKKIKEFQWKMEKEAYEKGDERLVLRFD